MSYKHFCILVTAMNTTLSSKAEFTMVYVFDLLDDNDNLNLELILKELF